MKVVKKELVNDDEASFIIIINLLFVCNFLSAMIELMLFSFHRILTGFKQRNTFLNKRQIILFWLDFIHASKQLAGTK